MNRKYRNTMKFKNSELKISKTPWTLDKYDTIKDATGDTLKLNGVEIPCGGWPSERMAEFDANSRLVLNSQDMFDLLVEVFNTSDGSLSSDLRLRIAEVLIKVNPTHINYEETT